ncbi:hypothetical protein [Moheibacter lacus]|uniref:Uncharacterized protein n=1 Tax=Moheibacter lacus TaxID=2745851 RepID=A0A838ZGW9_9FLAO|nr:hypothetical protein [Moheibacter lacus]MBA5628931.1 hypothetical protein [Moheibacter lacus]
MRKFNEREKKLISDLSKVSFSETEKFSFFLQMYYFTATSNKALLVFMQFQQALLYIKHDKFINIKDRKTELGEFLELLSLIIYLKEKRYISIYQVESQNAALQIMKEGFDNPRDDGKGHIFFNDKDYLVTNEATKILRDNHIVYEGINLPSDVYQLIIDNFFGVLYVSEELRELVKNDFCSEDDLKFNKQQTLAWIGIGVSLLLGLLSVLISS